MVIEHNLELVKAADWVLERLPDEHRPVLARARAVYLGEATEGWDDLRDRLEPFRDHIVARIDAERRVTDRRES